MQAAVQCQPNLSQDVATCREYDSDYSPLADVAFPNENLILANGHVRASAGDLAVLAKGHVRSRGPGGPRRFNGVTVAMVMRWRPYVQKWCSP